MLVVQIAILSFILIVIPTVIGTILAGKDSKSVGLPFYWVSGQILLWGGFQMLSLPLILKEKPFSLLVALFGLFMLVMTIIAICRWGSRLRKNCCCRENAGLLCKIRSFQIKEMLGWLFFILLLILQLVLTAFAAYEEGDDAFYVATSTITDHSNTMYRILPYTGLTTGLDARHGLAPFPVWVAFLARVSGMHAATVSHIALPMVLIIMAYAIYYLIARQLFETETKKIPMFLILAELLVIFGGYSVFSAENFLLVRASQGKAVIANIILPFLLYLMLLLLNDLKKEEKTLHDHFRVIENLVFIGFIQNFTSLSFYNNVNSATKLLHKCNIPM